MTRRLLIPAALLLALDVSTTALAPSLGLTQSAAAADFTGRVKNVRIRKKRVGSGFKVVTRVADEGDATAADAASLELTVCAGAVCSDGIVLAQDSYTGVFRSTRFAYDGALVPVGDYGLLTSLLDESGAAVGMAQSWTMTATDGELTATPNEDVDSAPYISDLTLTSDDCGNGKAKAHVEGDGASGVASVQWADLDGTLFSTDDVVACGTDVCIAGERKRGKTAYTVSDADLGALGELLADSAESVVTVSVSAYDTKGGLIGTTRTDAISKYGDILIDGVPLEFDLIGGTGPGDIDMFSLSGGTAGTSLKTWTLNDGEATSLKLVLANATDGKEVISTVATAPKSTQASFASAALSFDGGESAVGYSYTVLIDMIDANGDPVGLQREADLTVPTFDGKTVGTSYAVFRDGTGAVGLLHGEDGIFSQVVLAGDQGAISANIIFEEPFEGPAPLALESSMSEVATWDVWEVSTSTALPEAWTLTYSLTNAKGEELHSASTSGTGSTSAKVDPPPKSALASNLTVRGNLDVGGKLK